MKNILNLFFLLIFQTLFSAKDPQDAPRGWLDATFDVVSSATSWLTWEPSGKKFDDILTRFKRINKIDEFKKEWANLSSYTASRLIKHYGADGFTLLHHAAQQGLDPKMVTRMIEIGADVNAQTRDGTSFVGYTPLHLASMYGHIGLTKILLQKGASLTMKTQEGKTPLHIAKERGFKEISNLICEHLDLILNPKNKDLVELLSSDLKDYIFDHAMKLHLVHIFRYTVEQYTQIRDFHDTLLQSIKYGYTDFTNFLLEDMFSKIRKEHPENENIITDELCRQIDQSKCILDYASENYVILSIFLFWALVFNQERLVDIILEKENIDLNVPNPENGMAAIHIASYMERTKLLEKFIDKDADVKLKVNKEYMIKTDYLKIDVNIKGFYPVHMAVLGNKPDAINLLLQKGASVEEKVEGDPYNIPGQFTPLFLAIYLRLNNIVSLLLSKDVSLSISHPGGNALHMILQLLQADIASVGMGPQTEKLIKTDFLVLTQLLNKVRASRDFSTLEEKDDKSQTAIDLVMKIKDPYKSDLIALFTALFDHSVYLLSYYPKNAKYYSELEQKISPSKIDRLRLKAKILLYKTAAFMNRAKSCFVRKPAH